MGAMICLQPSTGQDFLWGPGCWREDKTSSCWEGCACSELLALNAAEGKEVGEGGADSTCGEDCCCSAMIGEGAEPE